MTDTDERPIVLVPMPAGSWWVLLGLGLAGLGPLFGFLAGSMVGTGADGQSFSPIYTYLFIGMVIGGLGVAMAGVGGLKLYRGWKA